MNCFVTGGSGMVGSYLLLKLSERGYSILALKRTSSKLEFTRRLFRHILADKGSHLFEKIQWIDGDLSDYDTISEAVSRSDYVFHAAAMVSFKPSDREDMLYTNVQGTANVVNACLEHNIKKMCHLSSVAALGDSLPGEKLTEETEKTEFKHLSDYALSKYESEQEVWRGIAEGLNAVIVNPTIILGAGNWQASSARMYSAVWEGMRYYTRGASGFVDARDVAEIMIQLCEGDIAGERFILNAENRPFRYIFNQIADSLQKKRPQKEVGFLLLKSITFVEKIRYLITGKEPRLTKFTIRSSLSSQTYANEKIKKSLSYSFFPIEKTIKDIAAVFLKSIEN